ncbi:MAG: hypothetical protein ABW170_10090 [Candidatus Thiodiazotropha sp. L084R]
MRETRMPQANIFESYSEHEFGKQLRKLSRLPDERAPIVIPLIKDDLITQKESLD